MGEMSIMNRRLGSGHSHSHSMVEGQRLHGAVSGGGYARGNRVPHQRPGCIDSSVVSPSDRAVDE